MPAKFEIPQGLKPAVEMVSIGAAEAAPLQRGCQQSHTDSVARRNPASRQQPSETAETPVTTSAWAMLAMVAALPVAALRGRSVAAYRELGSSTSASWSAAGFGGSGRAGTRSRCSCSGSGFPAYSDHLAFAPAHRSPQPLVARPRFALARSLRGSKPDSLLLFDQRNSEPAAPSSIAIRKQFAAS